jgi:sugar O-acyltransferase (sialic acid O-acetyltransferase NeuD family)
MTKSLLVLACGGHGRVVADAATECGYEEIAFLDDAHDTLTPVIGFPVLGPLSLIEQLAASWPNAIAAVGNGATRQQLFRRLREAGYRTCSIVHPSAVVSRRASVGEGVLVAAGAVINVGAKIGDAAIVNTGARIDHDCIIGSAAHIAPGTTLSGGVTVGERAWLGTGCSVRQGITIGDDVMVGVGAAVVADLTVAGTYAGVPARRLEKHA